MCLAGLTVQGQRYNLRLRSSFEQAKERITYSCVRRDYCWLVGHRIGHATLLILQIPRTSVVHRVYEVAMY